MVDHNIQMKKYTNGEWENHYPLTKTSNVIEASSSKYLDNILTSIRTNIAKVFNQSNIINVRNFGAVGDGIHDDTPAIQSAINSINDRSQTVFFPATTDGFYKVTSLTIPEKAVVSNFSGEGAARILFTDKIGFHIKAESIIFEHLFIRHIGDNHEGVIIFNDEREYNRLDFDITLFNCNFSYASIVVNTWGRGVVFNNCSFNDVTDEIISVTVKKSSEIELGSYDIQNYENGYRGYMIRNSRIHYCNTAWIMRTYNDIEKVVQGVTITNNYIEGGIGYYKGFVRNMLVKNNNHIQADTTKVALFEFEGFIDVDMDIKISGMQSNNDGKSKRINRLIESTEFAEHLRLSGSLRGVKKHVITFLNGGDNLSIDLNVTDVVGDTYSPSLVMLGGSRTYDALLIKGIFLSQHDDTIVINSTKEHTVYNLNHSGLIVRGDYASLTNII